MSVQQVAFIKNWNYYLPLESGYKKYTAHYLETKFGVPANTKIVIITLKKQTNQIIKNIRYIGETFKMENGSAYLQTSGTSVRQLIEKVASTLTNLNKDAMYVLFSAADLRVRELSGQPYIIPVPFTLEEAISISNAINHVNGAEVLKVFLNGKEYNPSEAEAVSVDAEVAEKRDADFFYVDPVVNQTLTYAYMHMQRTGYANVLFTGPSGTGKSSVAGKLAKKLEFDFVKFDLSMATEPSDFLGTTVLENGTSKFKTTPFVEAIEKGNVVILLDEINRCYPNVANPLLALMDDSHTLTYMERQYKVAPNTIFIVSANIGSTYTGTFTADEALMNRMNASVQMNHMPADKEVTVLYNRVAGLSTVQATSIVKFLHEARQLEVEVDFSIRAALSIASAVACGFSLRTAAMMVFGRVPMEVSKQIQDILSKQGHKEAKSPKLLF